MTGIKCVFRLTRCKGTIDSGKNIFRFVIEIGCKQNLVENLFSIEKVCNQSLFYDWIEVLRLIKHWGILFK